MIDRTPPAKETGKGTIRVLIVSAVDADCEQLRQILSPNKWMLFPVPTVEAARRQLRATADVFCVVVCERDLLSGSWRDLAGDLAAMPDPPFLIVSSQVADEQLWAEVLQVGAYDVLVKPFEPGEVRRVLTSAWEPMPCRASQCHLS